LSAVHGSRQRFLHRLGSRVRKLVEGLSEHSGELDVVELAAHAVQARLQIFKLACGLFDFATTYATGPPVALGCLGS